MSGTFGNFVPTWPYQPAGGVTIDDTFVPFQLFAGEADIVTDDEYAGQNMPIFQVVARDTLNGGVLVPWNPVAGDGAPVAYATGTYTFSGSALPAVGDTVTINGNVLTFAAFPTNTVAQIPAAPMVGEVPNLTQGTVYLGAATTVNEVVGDDIYTTAGTAEQNTAFNLAQYVNAFKQTLGVSASIDSTGLIVTIEANSAGTAGNSITIAKSSSAITVSGATLTGGTVDSTRPLSTGKAIGILGAPATSGVKVPFYVGGFFNHEVLVWPSMINTLAQRKAAFDGTRISVGGLV